MPEPLTPLQLLEAVSYALNMVRNTKLRGCPHGFKDTYALAAEVERHKAQQTAEPWGQFEKRLGYTAGKIPERPFNPDTHNDRVGPWPSSGPQGSSCPCGFHGDDFCKQIGCPRNEP